MLVGEANELFLFLRGKEKTKGEFFIINGIQIFEPFREQRRSKEAQILSLKNFNKIGLLLLIRPEDHVNIT